MIFLTTCPRSRIREMSAVLLSYLLAVAVCAPLTIARRLPLKAKSNARMSLQAAATAREGELLVRFRSGVSQRDKESIVATHGARRKKQQKG